MAVWDAGDGGKQLMEWRGEVEAWGERAETTLREFNTHSTKVLTERRAKFAERIALFGKADTSHTPSSPSNRSSHPPKVPRIINPGKGALESKINSEGLSAYSDKLLRISSIIEELQREGADRGSVQSCLTHFVTSAYRKPAISPPRGSSPNVTPRGNVGLSSQPAAQPSPNKVKYGGSLDCVVTPTGSR